MFDRISIGLFISYFSAVLHYAICKTMSMQNIILFNDFRENGYVFAIIIIILSIICSVAEDFAKNWKIKFLKNDEFIGNNKSNKNYIISVVLVPLIWWIIDDAVTNWEWFFTQSFGVWYSILVFFGIYQFVKIINNKTKCN